MNDLGTIAVACLTSIPCAILGCFLVLRRMSLLGDAISHAVLPGLALAFIVTGTRNGAAMAIGAIAIGLLTAFLIQMLTKVAGVSEDASIGVVYTSLFSIGVIMITAVADRVDLDPGCVLYGLIEMTPINTFTIFELEIPRATLTLLPALVFTIAFVTVFWKELKLISFDPALATAMGFSVSLIHYLLMAMVAGVTVVSFEAVGSILVVAMLIVPAATVSLLTDRLLGMVLWSAGIAVLSSVLGYYGSVWLNTSTAGMMAVAAGVIFAVAVVFAPRYGLLQKLFIKPSEA